MENEKQLAKLRDQILIFVSVVAVLCIGLAGFILYQLIDVKWPVSLILCLSVLVVILLASSVIIIWLGNLRYKQLIDCLCLKIENDKKRDYDKVQSQLNHDYRMAALESENLHQIVKEISDKKETTEIKDGKTEKVVKISLNTALVDDIKKLKIEIEKI